MPRYQFLQSRWLLLALIFVAGLLIALPALSNYWFGDDFFLVRPYTNTELIEGLTGNYDPSSEGIAGWRPLTRFFYNGADRLFGGSVAVFRVFQIALFAVHVTLLVLIGRRLGMTVLQVTVAGIVIVCSKNAWWILTWPTDSIRSFMGLLGGLSAWFLLDYLDKWQRWKLAASVICFIAAVLVREEILFYGAVVPAIAAAYSITRFPGKAIRSWIHSREWRALFLWIVLAGIFVIIFWVVRARFVPNSITHLAAYGWLFNLVLVLFPRLPVDSIVLSIALIIGFWAFIVISLRAIPSHARLLAFFWLGCVVAACSPGLGSGRGNNLVLPLGFWGLFLATVFVSVANKSPVWRWSAIVLLALFVAGSASLSRTAQENIFPTSSEYYTYNRLLLWGSYAAAYIPQDRRDYLLARYAELGITSEESFQAIFPQIMADALASGRRHPDSLGQPFVPIYGSYLHGW